MDGSIGWMRIGGERVAKNVGRNGRGKAGERERKREGRLRPDQGGIPVGWGR